MYEYDEELMREAHSANKHPLNLEAQRWRREYAKMLKEQFSVEPFGWDLHVDDFLLDSADELEKRRILGSERAEVMREIVWNDLPGSPKERLQWWLGLPGEEPTHLVGRPGGDPTDLVKRLKQASNLQVAMGEVVEAFHWYLIADPDLSGIYDPMGTLD